MKLTKTKLRNLIREELLNEAPSKPILKRPTLQVFKTEEGGLSFRDRDKRIAFLTKDDVKDVKKLLNRMPEF